MTPKELGELADNYWRTYQLRLQADKAAATLKVEESKLKAALIEALRTEELTSVGGQTVRLTLATSEEPVVQDWEAVYGYMTQNNDFSLVQRRINGAAVKERWQAGEQVPGVGVFEVYKLSRSKL